MVGRTHMKKWPNFHQYMIEKGPRIDTFLASDTTSEDAFLLYAALRSPKTFILTNDLLRDHKAKISEEHEQLYRRWLRCRQIMVPLKYSSLHPYSIRRKPDFDEILNISPDWTTVHVPFEDSHDKVSWLCARKSIK